jgi:hypothetical protein
VIGGQGGTFCKHLGQMPETPSAKLSPQARRLRRLRKSLSNGERRPVHVLEGQVSFDEHDESAA